MKWRRNKKKKQTTMWTWFFCNYLCVFGEVKVIFGPHFVPFLLCLLSFYVFSFRELSLFFFIPSNDFRIRSNQWLHLNIQWPWTFQASTFASTFALHNINLKWVASMKTRYKFNQTKRWNVKMTMERTGFSCSIVGTFVYLMYLPAPIHARFIS